MATKTKLKFGESLARLKESEEFPISALYAFSNLEPQDQTRFEAEWPSLTVERQRRVVATLAELAEEDVKLDFSTLYFFTLSDPDAQVRGKSIEGLWEDESRELLTKLLTILNDDPDVSVREKAALGISRYAYLAELGKLKERWANRLHETLVTLVTDPRTPMPVFRRCLEALGYFSTDDRVIKLVEKAYDSDDELIKGSALKAMGHSINKRWLPEVGKDLSNAAPLLRYEAVMAAGEMGSDELLQPIINLTGDHDREVQLAAVWSLGQIGGPEASRFLKEIGESDDETMAAAALEALDEITYAANPMNVL